MISSLREALTHLSTNPVQATSRLEHLYYSDPCQFLLNLTTLAVSQDSNDQQPLVLFNLFGVRSLAEDSDRCLAKSTNNKQPHLKATLLQLIYDSLIILIKHQSFKLSQRRLLAPIVIKTCIQLQFNPNFIKQFASIGFQSSLCAAIFIADCLLQVREISITIRLNLVGSSIDQMADQAIKSQGFNSQLQVAFGLLFLKFSKQVLKCSSQIHFEKLFRSQQLVLGDLTNVSHGALPSMLERKDVFEQGVDYNMIDIGRRCIELLAYLARLQLTTNDQKVVGNAYCFMANCCRFATLQTALENTDKQFLHEAILCFCELTPSQLSLSDDDPQQFVQEFQDALVVCDAQRLKGGLMLFLRQGAKQINGFGRYFTQFFINVQLMLVGQLPCEQFIQFYLLNVSLLAKCTFETSIVGLCGLKNYIIENGQELMPMLSRVYIHLSKMSLTSLQTSLMLLFQRCLCQMMKFTSYRQAHRPIILQSFRKDCLVSTKEPTLVSYAMRSLMEGLLCSGQVLLVSEGYLTFMRQLWELLIAAIITTYQNELIGVVQTIFKSQRLKDALMTPQSHQKLIRNTTQRLLGLYAAKQADNECLVHQSLTKILVQACNSSVSNLMTQRGISFIVRLFESEEVIYRFDSYLKITANVLQRGQDTVTCFSEQAYNTIVEGLLETDIDSQWCEVLEILVLVAKLNIRTEYRTKLLKRFHEGIYQQEIQHCLLGALILLLVSSIDNETAQKWDNFIEACSTVLKRDIVQLSQVSTVIPAKNQPRIMLMLQVCLIYQIAHANYQSSQSTNLNQQQYTQTLSRPRILLNGVFSELQFLDVCSTPLSDTFFCQLLFCVRLSMTYLHEVSRQLALKLTLNMFNVYTSQWTTMKHEQKGDLTKKMIKQSSQLTSTMSLNCLTLVHHPVVHSNALAQFQHLYNSCRQQIDRLAQEMNLRWLLTNLNGCKVVNGKPRVIYKVRAG